MHLSFVDYLADPITKEPLRLEISEQSGDFVERGILKSSTNSYPIVRGIPRFVDYETENYSRSFGYQWHKWPRLQFDSENIGKAMEGYTLAMWKKITGVDDSVDLNGAVIADIGCGPGRFIEAARSKGCKVIGIDYSAAVEVARQNFKHDPNVCVCQADALNLPFRPRSIEGAFSVGVLHHTPSPENGVRQALAAIKAEGWFALSVYGKNGYYDFPTVQLWRRIFKTLWPVMGPYPALAFTYATVCTFWPVAHYLPPVGKVIRAIFPFIKLPDLQWSLLDTFDSVTPSYQTAHSSFEVFSWLKRAGFTQVEPTDWGFSSYRGCAPRHHEAIRTAA